MPTNSVIIPTRHRYAEVIRLLESLRRQTLLPDEVVIVDASDQPYLKILLDQLFASALPALIYIHSTAGKTHQLNTGIQASHGEIVSLFDDDMELLPNYLEQIVAAFVAHPECGGGMGRIVGTSVSTGMNRFLQAAFLLSESGTRGYYKASGFPCLPHGSDQFQYTESLSGGCTHLRRSVALEFPMDEKLGEFGYSVMDDDDIAYRVSRRYKLFYQPTALIRHLGSTATRSRLLKRRLIRHHEYLYYKNSPKQLKHRLAFLGSIVGLEISAVWGRDITGGLGVLQGIWDILRGRRLR